MAMSDKKNAQKRLPMLAQSCAEDFDIFCEQCDRDDIRLPAIGYCMDCEEHLCETCFNTHRRPKSLRHHQLQDKDQMPRKQNLEICSSSNAGGQTYNFSPCPKHAKEVLTFYCKDHNALICYECVALEHTSATCHVDNVAETLPQIVDSTEYRQTLQELEKLAEKCYQLKKDVKQREIDNEVSSKSIIERIDNLRKEINERLDELEQVAKHTATEIQHDNKGKLEATETACNDINKLVQVSTNILKHFNTDKKAEKLFTELKMAQLQTKHNEKRLSQVTSANDIDEISFEPNPAIKELIQNEKSIGTLKVKKVKMSSKPLNPPMEPMMLSTPRKINVKSSSEPNDCLITGIAASGNEIFVADNKNFSVKKIDVQSGVISLLFLDGNPSDVTIVSEDTIAVTIPKMKTIQFISVSSNSLTLKKQLQVGDECHGITHHQGKLAVTFPDAAQLQIMNLIGIVKIKVQNNRKETNMFGFPHYVTSNSQSIYVSDVKEVKRFNWKGEIIGRYDGIEMTDGIRPSGITLLDNGTVLVTNYNNCITRIDKDCKGSETVLETDWNLGAICWCTKTRSLYVSIPNKYFNHDETKHYNWIQSYKML